MGTKERMLGKSVKMRTIKMPYSVSESFLTDVWANPANSPDKKPSNTAGDMLAAEV